jgi:nitrous oxide reductase
VQGLKGQEAADFYKAERDWCIAEIKKHIHPEVKAVRHKPIADAQSFITVLSHVELCYNMTCIAGS